MSLSTVSSARPRITPLAQPFISDDQPQNQEQLKIFTGTIVSMNNELFFLKDDTKNAWYGLDNQALASKFADKKVSVTGTLDKTDMIHIKNIEEQKA